VAPAAAAGAAASELKSLRSKRNQSSSPQRARRAGVALQTSHTAIVMASCSSWIAIKVAAWQPVFAGLLQELRIASPNSISILAASEMSAISRFICM
jgi:hypothetical protein